MSWFDNTEPLGAPDTRVVPYAHIHLPGPSPPANIKDWGQEEHQKVSPLVLQRTVFTGKAENLVPIWMLFSCGAKPLSFWERVNKACQPSGTVETLCCQRTVK